VAFLEELIYAQAQRELERQERAVAELRQRAGTLVAGASLTGGVFAAAALQRGSLDGWATAGLVGVVVALLVALGILLPQRLVFALDPDELYAGLWEDREDSATAYRRLADVLWRARQRNAPRVELLHRAFAGAVAALAASVCFWGVSVAVS